MRIRTIKPEFWKCEDLATCSDKARLLAIGLLNYCDDEGFFNANPALIQSELFPFDQKIDIPVLLLELSSKAQYVGFGEADGKKYGHVINFLKHQVISHPKPSTIKDLCIFQYASSNVPVILHPEWKGMEGKGTESAPEQTPARKTELTDSEFWEEMVKKFTWINVSHERAKMEAWLLTPKGKGRKMTRRFVVAWLCKLDKPMEPAIKQDPRRAYT